MSTIKKRAQRIEVERTGTPYSHLNWVDVDGDTYGYFYKELPDPQVQHYIAKRTNETGNGFVWEIYPIPTLQALEVRHGILYRRWIKRSGCYLLYRNKRKGEK